MIEKESCVRSSRLIPLADDIYCLVFSASLTLSPPVTLLVMQFIKVKKFGRICFRFFLFPIIDCFPATFQFHFISMPILMLRTLRTEPCDNTRIFIMPLHTSKSTLDNCIVWFGYSCCCCCSWLYSTYVHTNFKSFVAGRKKIPSERAKKEIDVKNSNEKCRARHRIHFGIHFKTKLEYNAFSAGKYAISRVLVCLCRFLCPPSQHTHTYHPLYTRTLTQSASLDSAQLCSNGVYCVRLRTNATHPRDQTEAFSPYFGLCHCTFDPSISYIRTDRKWTRNVYDAMASSRTN